MISHRMSAIVPIMIASVIALGGAESAAAQEGAAVTPARVRAALLRYRSEPSIEAIVRAAIQTSVLDPERARDAAERARLAGLLPQVRADIRRGVGLDLSALQSFTGERNTERNIWSSDDTLTFSGGLTFQFNRLIFATEESSLLRERRQLEESRFAMLTQVVHLYFERRRLQLERDLTGRTEVSIEMRIAEAEALLDLFTNGAFSRMMRESIAGEGAPHPEDDMEDDPEEAE